MKKGACLAETQLFAPVRDFFAKLGYEVHGEVKGCDLTASKDRELIIVEFKRHLNLDLLIQAVKRQRLTADVYIAVPKPCARTSARKWKDLCFLVRRLELGLLTVSFHGEQPTVEVLIDPAPFEREKSRRAAAKRRKSLRAEIAGRHGNYNLGGSTGKKLMTAYKENAIHIACCLKKYGPLAPKQLRAMGTGKKTLSILSKNYYGWFERVSHGIYQLSTQGEAGLEAYPDLVAYYESLIKNDGDPLD